MATKKEIRDLEEADLSTPAQNNKGSKALHAQRRQLAYEYHIRRLPTVEIAAKIGVSTRQVRRYIQEVELQKQQELQQTGQFEKHMQDYIDAQDAVILKGWEILENPKLGLTSQNVGTILGHISQAEERKAKARGLLVDRTKIDAEVNGKVTILDLVAAAKKEKK